MVIIVINVQDLDLSVDLSAASAAADSEEWNLGFCLMLEVYGIKSFSYSFSYCSLLKFFLFLLFVVRLLLWVFLQFCSSLLLWQDFALLWYHSYKKIATSFNQGVMVKLFKFVTSSCGISWLNGIHQTLVFFPNYVAHKVLYLLLYKIYLLKMKLLFQNLAHKVARIHW